MKFDRKRWIALIQLTLIATLLYNMGVSAQDKKSTDPPSLSGELLYNGIRLPEVWPPKDGNPFSYEPMAVPYLKHPPEVIPINIGRQLFVDDFLIEKTNLDRVFHQAEKYEGNPVIKQASTRQGGVFYDPIEKRFAIYYNDGSHGVAMAVSQDLKHWSNPDGTRQGPGERLIVLPKGGANSFWLHTEDTSGRMFFAMRAEKLNPKPENDPNLPYINLNWQNMLRVSADGINWSAPTPLGRSNDYSSFFYNPFRKVWGFSLKENVPRTGKKLYRSRYYAERKHIPKPGTFDDAVFWVNADKLDKPLPNVGDTAQLYSLQAVAYESIMLGAFQVHLGPTNEISDKKNEPKFTEIKLGYSRDGFHWHRPDREAFIKGTYRDGDWDKAFINIPTGIFLVVGDTLWIPYTGYSGVDPDGERGMYSGPNIGLAALRRDGFASMEADERKGTLLTRPVVFDGTHLFVNVDCPKGELRVEALDEHGRASKPFTVKKCKPIRANKTLYKVEWKSGRDLSSLAGKPVRFRFYLTNGKLYSFWVSPDKNGASHGYLGAGAPGLKGVVDNQGIKAY